MGTKRRTKLLWNGNYDHGYWGDDDGTYCGSDYVEVKVGDFANNFQYRIDLSSRNNKGRYNLRIRFRHDYQTYGEVFYGNFKTKRKAKINAIKEIRKFENDRERVMEIWREIMKKDSRTAIFRMDNYDSNKFEWITSGFIGNGGWNVMGEQGMYSSFGKPRYEGISGYCLTLSKDRFGDDCLYSWDRCERSGGCMSGGGVKEVPMNLAELEPDIINCLRNAEFDENKYKWMLLRQNNYGAVDKSILVEMKVDKNR